MAATQMVPRPDDSMLYRTAYSTCAIAVLFSVIMIATSSVYRDWQMLTVSGLLLAAVSAIGWLWLHAASNRPNTRPFRPGHIQRSIDLYGAMAKANLPIANRAWIAMSDASLADPVLWDRLMTILRRITEDARERRRGDHATTDYIRELEEFRALLTERVQSDSD